MQPANQTYVYDGTEVRKTGRSASRDTQTMKGLRKTDIVEITPVDPDLEWKKWVKPDELFVVNGDST